MSNISYGDSYVTPVDTAPITGKKGNNTEWDKMTDAHQSRQGAAAQLNVSGKPVGDYLEKQQKERQKLHILFWDI